MMTLKGTGLLVGSLAVLISTASTAAFAATPAPFRVVWDDFQSGFTTGAVGSSARWFFQSAGPFTFNDGVATTDSAGLHVAPPGVNPVTGNPAFSMTVGQEGSVDNPLGLPGDLDHPKWLAYANHLSSIGTPGFDLVPGQELACEAVISGRTFGTGQSPFHGVSPDTDVRLANYSLTSIDTESFVIAEFFVTNNVVYALYERLAAARGTLGNYAAFTYQVPVALTRPGQAQRLALAFDKAAGTIRWLIDRQEVFRINRIGELLPRIAMTIDHGGTPTLVSPRSIDCGLGMFTLLDGARPLDTGLVELSNAAGYYFDPLFGPPTPGRFFDTQSLHQDRLWGQGARLDVGRVVFASRLTSGPDWSALPDN